MIVRTYTLWCAACRDSMSHFGGLKPEESAVRVIVESAGIVESLGPIQTGISVSACKHCILEIGVR